jgi:hypothetical protein
MKRLLLISLLSSMFIGQASCNVDQIVTKSGTDICIAAVAGVASFLAPALVAHYYSKITLATTTWTAKEAQDAQAQSTTWWWCAAAIITGSVLTMYKTKNETVSLTAACSALGAVLSIALFREIKREELI